MANRIEILSVRAADGGARLVLTLECVSEDEKKRETLSVLTARVSRVPQKGKIDADTYELLHREHALCAALTTGMRSLSAGGGSRLQLWQKLCGKGVARDIAEEAVRVLCEKGCLDECAGALSCAQSGLRKLWGDRRILADLRAKGYGEAELLAVQEMLREKDGTARCVRLLQKRHFDTENPEKLIASLMRYGYTRTEIRAALREVME